MRVPEESAERSRGELGKLDQPRISEQRRVILEERPDLVRCMGSVGSSGRGRLTRLNGPLLLSGPFAPLVHRTQHLCLPSRLIATQYLSLHHTQNSGIITLVL